jgi:hypothetical protein
LDKLGDNSLQKLHWDFTDNGLNAGTTIIADEARINAKSCFGWIRASFAKSAVIAVLVVGVFSAIISLP